MKKASAEITVCLDMDDRFWVQKYIKNDSRSNPSLPPCAFFSLKFGPIPHGPVFVSIAQRQLLSFYLHPIDIIALAQMPPAPVQRGSN